jgi:2-polyprenyl-6-methoxyphenol hydroxylase-like FAD-dependent oxidoreductase
MPALTASPIEHVLVVGGGTVGNTLTVLLRQRGIAVDLVELTDDWSALGSGITLQGNGLRVLRELGRWDEMQANMVTSDGQFGNPFGDDIPAGAGMFRPVLQRILSAAVSDSGADVRLGTTVVSLDDDGRQVTATFTDGTRRSYDLVVGADGIGSKVRSMIGIDIEPVATGMAIWRVHAKRPASVEHRGLEHGGACYIAGYNPTSPTTLYAFLVEDARDRSELPKEIWVDEMRRLAEPYGDPWPEIREDITDPDRIDYRYFDWLLIDDPWNRGRIIVIGDAAHACPPTIAQGAAQGLEDAWVLVELLADRGVVDQQLFDDFMARRFDRVELMVDASVRLCHALLDHEPPEVGGQIMRTAMANFSQRP